MNYFIVANVKRFLLILQAKCFFELLLQLPFIQGLYELHILVLTVLESRLLLQLSGLGVVRDQLS